MTARVQRKLTTILAADAAGYSRHMEVDEVGALASLQAARRVFATFIERHEGRIANTAGDGLLAEFPSVVEAVQCAVEVQRELDTHREEPDGVLRFRIGIHLGDVIVDGDDLLGEGVNLAARLQTMAEPGGILISQQVYDQVHSKLAVSFEFLGGKRPKNYAHPVAVYRISSGRPGPVHRDGPGLPHEAERGEPARSRKAGEDDLAARWSRVRRIAMRLGVVFAAIVVINLATWSGTFWAVWPAIGFATYLGFEAAPLLARGVLPLWWARMGVLIACLALVNAASWSGELWVLWPAGALITVGFLLQIGARAR